MLSRVSILSRSEPVKDCHLGYRRATLTAAHAACRKAMRTARSSSDNVLQVGRRQSRNSNCSEFWSTSSTLPFGSANKQLYSSLQQRLLILRSCCSSADQQHTDLCQNLDLAVPGVVPTQASHKGGDCHSTARAHTFFGSPAVKLSQVLTLCGSAYRCGTNPKSVSLASMRVYTERCKVRSRPRQ